MQQERPTMTTPDGKQFNIGQIGILIIQGFAIFVAFSTLLGRIYFREYTIALKIPGSEFRLNAVDYSVISPDVAISGFGVAIFSIVLVISFKWRIEPKYRWFIFLFGVAVLAASFFTVLRDLSNDDIPEPGVGAFGIWWVLFLASWTLGTALIISALIPWVADNAAIDRRPKPKPRWELHLVVMHQWGHRSRSCTMSPIPSTTATRLLSQNIAAPLRA